MTPIADMVARMLADSEPATAIVAAVRALEVVTLNNALRNVTSRVTSREQAKVRQQNYRNRQKEQQLAKEAQANDGVDRNASVTRDSVTATLSDSVVSSSFLLTGEPLKKESSGIQARARGTRMAPGTLLTDDHRALIVAEGISDPEKLWAEFVDYWSDIPGQRGVKVKWDGTLRNRCREVIKRGFNNGHRTGNTRTTGHDAILAVAARKARELDRNDDVAGTANTAGFAFGDGTDRSGPDGNPSEIGRDSENHDRIKPDDQRIREGEIIPPDKDAAGVPGRRQFV